MIAGLHVADFTVLIVYLAATSALGIWFGRGAKNIAEFFMPRKFGKTAMVMSAFGAGTASDQAVGVASATFTSGLSGIWYQWLWLFVTPFYWIIAPVFRRLRAVTTADAYSLRYDNSVALLFSVVGIVSIGVKIGMILKGTGALMESSTGAQVNPEIAIFITAVLFVTYGMLGGLAAAIITDMIQGTLIVVFSFMLLPFVLGDVGGLEGVRETITDPAKLSLVAPGKISVFFIIMMGLQALVGIVAQPHIMGVCGAGKTELEGRVGLMGGNFIKRFCTIAWCLTAIAALAWYIRHGVPLDSVVPDNVYGDMAQEFLPRATPGLLGLFLAAMIAGIMGSCDNYMLAAGALFTQNIYRPWRPGCTDSHYLWIGRASSLIVVAGAIAFAFWVENVIRALEIWFQIAPMMGIVFWIGLLWRRMTVAGAWAATFSGFGVWLLTELPFFVNWLATFPLARSWKLVWIEGAKIEVYLPWQILGYMTVASLTGIVISLLTKPVPKEQLDRFYTLTRTPIVPGEVIEEPCTLPKGVTPAQRPMLITAFGLEIPTLSRTSIIGFFVGWIMVALLISGFVLLIKW
ncbi:MAG: sodium:solute symporter family protein [Candidatus Hydrogenedentes bacterium]|nr:sodium:solute symporter family protein [Candidatus Hydrogenedentota bacterium]